MEEYLKGICGELCQVTVEGAGVFMGQLNATDYAGIFEVLTTGKNEQTAQRMEIPAAFRGDRVTSVMRLEAANE